MNVHAVFIDMDGTLLTASNNISRRNLEAIHKLMNQGIKVFLATGRHYEITAPYHKELGLQTPMICLNGASIHDSWTGKMMQINSVHLNEERLHQVTSNNYYNVIAHTTSGLYCRKLSPEIQRWTEEGRVAPRYIGDLRKANYQDVLKYSIHTGRPSPELSSLFKHEADVVNWDNGFELIAQGVSKWSAIQTLLRVFGISKHKVLTIGDGPNDIQMLRHAGVGVAMGNAKQEVKDVADFVAGHHQNDGLADFFEKNIIAPYHFAKESSI